LISVEVDELAAVDPERGLAVELRRPLLDLRERPKPPQELRVHASRE
jgi:hypothetical protein